MIQYFIVIIVGYLLYSKFIRPKEKVASNYCHTESANESFATQCDYTDKEAAAKTMSDLNIIGHSLTDYLVDRYGTAGGHTRALMARNLQKRYGGSASLRETHPHNKENDTSYTIDKGDILSLCLRTGSGDLHDFETLKFVFLHELTHIAANVYQHPDKFWQMFKIILQESEAAGLYRPINYSNRPVKYCGKLDISYNPYYDHTLMDLD